MIARHWTGVARMEAAASYIAHLEQDTFPGLARLPGFVRASVLRRIHPRGVEFLVVTEWESMDAIRAFAGDTAETAVVPPVVRAMMVEYDRQVRHFEVAATFMP